jgi:hypothetical protein
VWTQEANGTNPFHFISHAFGASGIFLLITTYYACLGISAFENLRYG